jgi:hypothetical protein
LHFLGVALRIARLVFQPLCGSVGLRLHLAKVRREMLATNGLNGAHGMAQIFLSYSRKDHGPMTAVKTALIRARLTVWTDEELQPGTPWQRRIESEIKAAFCMVVLLSPAAKDSDWVRAEISRARMAGINIVPMIVDGQTPEDFLPLGFENMDWIDIRRRDQVARGLARLVEAVTSAIVPVIAGKDPDDFPPPRFENANWADNRRRERAGGLARPPKRGTPPARGSDVAVASTYASVAAEEGPVDDTYDWRDIGRVLVYYSRADAVGVELRGSIQLGDLLCFSHGGSGLLQRVESIEKNRKRVTQAAAGEQVGINVGAVVKPGSMVEKAINADRALYVGTVSHFYSHLSVISVHLNDSLAPGDRIEVRGPQTRFVQTVRSIEIDRRPVIATRAGQHIGLAAILPAREGDRVYRFV